MRLVVAVGLIAFAAGGCLSVQTPSVSPRDMSSGHTVLLVGDSLMGGAAAELPQVLQTFGVGGIAIVDAHRNGSGLATSIDDMTPAEYVESQFEARPDIDIVAMEWAGACQKPCTDYGSSRVLRPVEHERGRRAGRGPRARRAAHRREAPATTTG